MDLLFKEKICELMRSRSALVVLTGAGISAESGIPTFRGPEGYWTIGSQNYRPEEMATNAMFSRHPDEVWQWYLYRRGVCNNAEPNAGHKAVVEMENLLQDSFLLITQNVDGLHIRAGNSNKRTYEIHGNINRMRCASGCRREDYPVPEDVSPKEKDEQLNDKDRALLTCPFCKGLSRPHVLWFDECYDEEYYRFNSSITAAASADFLISVGTSGATNLPMQVGNLAARKGAVLADINPEANPFSSMAKNNGGFFLQGASGKILADIVKTMKEV